jgi:hypothetical protein
VTTPLRISIEQALRTGAFVNLPGTYNVMARLSHPRDVSLNITLGEDAVPHHPRDLIEELNLHHLLLLSVCEALPHKYQCTREV